jgi:hypothetical protein
MRFIALVVTILVMSAAASGAVAQADDRATLVAALVKKADDAKQSHPGLAEQIYKLLLRFEPANGAVAAKTTGTVAMTREDIYAAGYTSGTALGNSSPAILRSPFGERSESIDLVMLRMVLDDRLVGNGMYADVMSQDFPFCVFLAVPRMPTTEVRATYGIPSSQTKDERGHEELTYGKLRLISDPSGKVVAVVTPAVW